MLKLMFDGADEPIGHISLGGSPDAGITVGLVSADLAFQVHKASGEALQNLPGFLGYMGQLAVGKARQIGNEDLAVIAKREKGGFGSAVG